MMHVTFLDHSGFLVELPGLTLLFDWWKGDLPPLPSGPLLVFASHRHPDHFDPRIFALDDGQRDVRFLLGKGIHLTDRNRKKWGLSEKAAADCRVLSGGESASPLPGVTVEALPSTDEGATKRMVDAAEALGADAVVGLRYASASVMQGAAEVIAYGTAVKFK